MDPVRKQSDAVALMAQDWTLIAAVLGGTKAMRGAGQTYLPKWPCEDHDSYKARLHTATLFPAYARTVSVLVGKPFSKPLTIGEDVPPRIVELLDDVDCQNRNLHSFASELCQDALAFGLCGILVDCPPNNGAVTVQQERAAGIRPYFVHVHHNNILGWKASSQAGGRVLTQLRLLEMVEEEDGAFGTKMIEQVRVLEVGRWSTWRKSTVGAVEKWMPHEEGLTSLLCIPFIPVYGKRRDFMVGEPPMLELAHANVEHWQSKSDQQTILHVARVPMLFAKAIGDSKIAVGAGAYISASSPDADVKYVEHSGKAIEAGRISILDLEDRMRQTGAELLVIKPGNTTEVSTIADNEMGMCDLQRIMQSVEDSLDQALDLMAKYLGEKDGGHVSIYRDFGAATLAEASAQLLHSMKVDGSLSFETFLTELKRRGILSPDVDVGTEIIKAKAEAPPIVAQEQVKV
jgi:hypothetical protein